MGRCEEACTPGQNPIYGGCAHLDSQQALAIRLLPYSRHELQDTWPIGLHIIPQPLNDKIEQVEDLQA